MNIIELKVKKNISEDIKLSQIYDQFNTLLKELRKRKLPDSTVQSINKDVEELNTTILTGTDLRKLIKTKQTAIVRLIEKELKLVPKNYYRTLWLALGMTAFGIPLGVLFGVLIKIPGLFALGIPFGLAIGVTVGTTMDKKAFNENRQLNVEIKY